MANSSQYYYSLGAINFMAYLCAMYVVYFKWYKYAIVYGTSIVHFMVLDTL